MRRSLARAAAWAADRLLAMLPLAIQRLCAWRIRERLLYRVFTIQYEMLSPEQQDLFWDHVFENNREQVMALARKNGWL